MDEVELKLAVPASSRAAVMRELRRGKVKAEALQALYFDTADQRLAARGMSLRLRREGTRWIQTAKAPAADLLRRLEHQVELDTDRPPEVDPQRHAGTPVGAALHKALGKRGQGSLLLRFTTDVERTVRVTRAFGSRIEVAFDEGAILAGDRSLAVSELEFELKAGSSAAVPRLAIVWMAKHGLWIIAASKAQRGAWLASGTDKADPVAASPLDVEGRHGAAGFLCAVVLNCLEQVLGNAALVANGVEAADVVHQLRVGIRRLRTALRELGASGPGLDPAWESTLRGTFRELGNHRDNNSIIPAEAARLAAAGGPELPRPTAEARRPLDAVVRDAAFQRALLEILAWVHAQPLAAADGGDDLSSAEALLRVRLDALQRRVVRDARRFSELDTTLQHRLRKRLKRLRYLCEFAAPLIGRKRVDRYLAAWKKAQDALGAYNDLRIASDAYRREAERHPQAWFAVGWLEADRKKSVKRCSRALRAAATTPPVWNG